MEKRVRRIEAAWIGSSHAAAHARQRGLRRTAVRRYRDDSYGQPLQPDNSLPAQVGGQWATPALQLPIVAINSVLLRTGKVLIFAYPWRPGSFPTTGETYEDSNTADAYVFDPLTGATKQVTPPVNPDTGKPAIIFCAGSSTLPDGRVLVVGGDVGDPRAAPNQGLNTVYVFDPVTESWEIGPRMRQGRWYPRQLQLPDGRTVIVAGLPELTDPDAGLFANTEIEIYNTDGTLQRLQNFKINGQPGNPELLGQYPHLWWMPAGHALVAGPRTTDTWLFHPPTPGRDDASWTALNPLPTHRHWATGVLLAGTATGGNTKVMLFGGADRDDHDPGGDGRNYPSVDSTIVYDDRTGKWSAGPSMRVPRSFANAVQLPDGKLAIVGGGTGEDGATWNYRWHYSADNKRVEIFDPATGTFTLGNAQAEGRTYHSTALLLPDARVVSLGDDINGPTGPGSGVRTDTAEIWSPPYLFDSSGAPARRPVLESAPASIDYGEPFTVTASGSVSRAVLIAPGATTHDNDMSQRIVLLENPVPVAGGFSLEAPGTANFAPPGFYMLFVLDAQGVPSTARFVQLADEPEVTPTPTRTATATPTASATATATATATPTPRLTLRVRAQRPRLARLRKQRRLRVALTPSRAAAVKVTLRLGGRRLARTRLHLSGPRTVSLRLSPTAARRLKGRRRVTLALRVVATPATGGRATAVRTLRLRR